MYARIQPFEPRNDLEREFKWELLLSTSPTFERPMKGMFETRQEILLLVERHGHTLVGA